VDPEATQHKSAATAATTALCCAINFANQADNQSTHEPFHCYNKTALYSMISSRFLARTTAQVSRLARTHRTIPLIVRAADTVVYSHQTPLVARFSSDSHDDFAPKRKAVPSDEDATQKMIEEHVTQNKVMLYMKGNPSMPMCGFSARVVQVLQKEGVDFASVNVLDYPSVREGIKKYANWPTIPQLYVNGEFIGGCDIVMSMHENGELKELLETAK
jgi:monothiol glutaredoxin